MSNISESFLSGSNIDFIEALFDRYLQDPGSVDPSWRDLFEQQRGDGRPIFVNGRGAVPDDFVTTPVAPAAAAPLARAEPTPNMMLQAKVAQAIYAFRLRGHLRAQLDPLGRPRPPLHNVADLALIDPNFFTPEELDQVVDSGDVFPQKKAKVRDILERLRQTYSMHVGVEYMTILDSNRRRWLMPRMEHGANTPNLSVEEQRRILTYLYRAQTFENFLHTKYLGAKRFALDGGESLIPMMDALLDEAGKLGTREIVIGMAHRGRLNVLTNILGKTPDEIFSEFEGPKDPKQFLRRGDVKYHMGFSSDVTTASGAKIHLSMAFNPSHLEAVDPVVEGRTRAKQDRSRDGTRRQVVPVLIHGDAAFAGQGVVAETLNLANLEGYTTGGTIHIVINNQVGFTTDPEQGRSNTYATLVAHMLDIPVFHVNGDDPEACVHVMRLATQYREEFNSDVVIDLVCYRRYGHNEGDEPRITQPVMYQLIDQRRPVAELYAEDLAQRGRIPKEESEAIKQKCLAELNAALERARTENLLKEPSAFEGLWKTYRGGADRDVPLPETGVPKERLVSLLQRICTLPEGFTPTKQLERWLEQRREMVAGHKPLDWNSGELLAHATLLTEGHDVRLTGQDVERGTFTHRMAVWTDAKTGQKYSPLQHLSPDQGAFRIYNSPLSEFACVGFEYGYSLDYPDAQVIWEAQFGDFANGAQVIIDQFIAAAETKWKRLSGLVMLLPHGYEGQGPEHSSARLERFLQLCAEDNMQVCYPTTPAQIFHLLRRQVLRPLRKPLIVMQGKSMLRRAGVESTFDELAEGRFRRLLREVDPTIDPKKVSRLLLCSGKVYYDLRDARAKRGDQTIAIVRLEQLYPLAADELVEVFKSYPKLQEIFWVQEEPKNMGAWSFIFPHLQEMVSQIHKSLTVGYIGRMEAASPAAGFTKAHDIEQALIVEQAMTRGSKNGR
ncbi:MAG: 2-oxoglutarate dehydrogenase E1 component [Myxococcaceae bacterium]|nr:2-oxoglutarate dehydrogenase E1 component [Myxococcaceae bacterium]